MYADVGGEGDDLRWHIGVFMKYMYEHLGGLMYTLQESFGHKASKDGIRELS